MATPRSQLVDPDTPLFYHLVSRCVRRSWLCGYDRETRKNYEHRKDWLEKRLMHLATCFAVEVYAYAIMSNHFHLVIYYDPGAAELWTDEEVADRWLNACAPVSSATEEDAAAMISLRRELLLHNDSQLEHARKSLGSLSIFMKHLKQPIAWRANREDGCSGHFFESRFYSGALLDEAAVVAAMAYVELNPVRANIVLNAADADHTSAGKHLINRSDRILAYLQPLVTGLAEQPEQSKPRISITVATYLDCLASLSRRIDPDNNEETKWVQRIALFRNKQRAYGLTDQLSRWATKNGWRRSGMALCQ